MFPSRAAPLVALLLWAAISSPAQEARAQEAPIRVSSGTFQTPQGKLALEEARHYLAKLFTNAIASQDSSPTLVLGTPETHPLIQRLVQEGKLLLPEGKNADQGYTLKTLDQTTYVAARTEIGMLYGLYGLLEEYGAYFQISGECLPRPTAFQVRPLNISIAPVFKYRGIMPWDNFLCGSSGYNQEDWQELLMRMTRMKYNKLDLHFYPGYVLYNEVWNNQPVKPRWAAQPDEFAPQGKPGAKAFGDMKLFSMRFWEENKTDRVKAAEDAQAMMRRVIDYSHDRGWAVVAGFALMQPVGGEFVMTRKSGNSQTGGLNTPDPLVEKNVELSLQRYRRLQQIYPNADYYWMWQTEAGGGMSRDVGEEPGAREMREKCGSWLGAHRPDRPAGDIDYAYLFRQVALRLSPQERAKLATGGWSIEHLFPGIDKDFPKEIIFASLNNADPARGVEWAESFKVSQQGRRSWMIAWWEFDGNQWFPQFRTSWHELKYKKAAEYGVESVSLLGWKTSAIEHHLRYLADFAWNPRLSAKEFYQQYCAKIYGPSAAPLIAPLYGIYDQWEARTPPATPGDDRPMLLGAGWCSMSLPNIPFSNETLNDAKWKHVVKRAGKILETQQQLLLEDQKSIALIQSLLPTMEPDNRRWAELLMNRLEFRALYLQSTQALNRSLILYDQTASASGVQAGAQAAKRESEISLKFAGQAIEKYAQEVRNRGDLGLIGQLNVQFYDIVAQLDQLFRLDSPYFTHNWKALRMNVAYRSDLSNPNAWPLRDGVAPVTPFVDEGVPALRIALAGTPQAKWGSRYIRRDAVSLEKEPLLDFYFRTRSTQPVALMFQVAGRDEWFQLDLLGQQTYKRLDRINPILELSDGQWHRCTWNLQKLVAERLGAEVISIRNLVVGTWAGPKEPVVVEFKHVHFGTFNQLDGLEIDR